MTDLLAKLQAATSFVKTKLSGQKASVAIVLGSGYSGFAAELSDRIEVPFSAIPHLPRATVQGHQGTLIYGRTSSGNPIYLLSGRLHFYEGYDFSEVTFPTRLLISLGTKNLILTNAAGSTQKTVPAGTVMLITDHINLMGTNPLRGNSGEGLGPRFVDLTQCYDPGLQTIALKAARKIHLRIKRGVYAALSGPTYETAAEIRMLSRLGASAAGMSTVPEAIVGRQMGARVLGISLITNLGPGLRRSNSPVTHKEVLEVVNRMKPTLFRFFNEIILKIGGTC